MLSSLIRNLFTKTHDEIFNNGLHHGVNKERDRQVTERTKIRRFEQEEWVGKKVIIVSNQWEDPLIGKVIGLEDFGRDEVHILVQCAISNRQIISFGKVIPFSPEILRAVVSLNPYDRWEMFTGQKIERKHPAELEQLSTYEELIQVLMDEGFVNWLDK